MTHKAMLIEAAVPICFGYLMGSFERREQDTDDIRQYNDHLHLGLYVLHEFVSIGVQADLGAEMPPIIG